MQQKLDITANVLSEILTTSRFYVELVWGSGDAADAYFMECKGLKYTQDVIEACEATPGKWGKAKHGALVRSKVPGHYKVGNITLKRGMMSQNASLWQWITAVQEGNWAAQRRDGALVVVEQGGLEGARFNFFNAWPISYSFGGSDVTGSSLAIEELELAIEDFVRVK